MATTTSAHPEDRRERTTPVDTSDADATRLRELGFEPQFNRQMSLRDNFALGFTYLSPVVGAYSLFAVAIATGGPPMLWSFLIVGVGQFLVALVFSELVSQYPIAGGVYPWARRLIGKKWAWMSGWVYAWALLVTITAVVFGAAPFAASFIGVDASRGFTIAVGLGLLVVVTLVNFGGTKLLARVAFFGFATELLGALLVGAYLLIFERNQSFSVLFDGFDLPAGEGTYLGAFLAAGLIGLYQYYGFEACGDVAEEVPDPGRRIPKAMRMTIYVGGAAASFAVLALILAIPDMNAVISGEDADPVGTLLATSFGDVGAKLVLAVILVSFFSNTMSLQAAISRMLFSYARDGMLAGSRVMQRVSPTTHVPIVPLIVSGVIPGLLLLTTLFSTDALVKIVSFGAAAIYVAFGMVVLGALVARTRGWVPSGPWTMGRWGMAVNVAALAWGILGLINLVWPRTPDAAWYDNYLVLISIGVVMLVGLAYMVLGRPYDHGTAPAGDAAAGSTSVSAR